MAAYEENGERNYYLQDELGSPLRIEDSAGNLKESYGYGAFGEDLYQNQGKIQSFGYTGYQGDEVSGTYYAQAREYLAENGRFAGPDLITGFAEYPETLNRYSYCWNNSLIYVDYDGEFPTIVVGAIVGGVIDGISSVATQIAEGKKVSVGKTVIDVVKGAIKGAVAGTGIGIVGSAFANGGIEIVGETIKQSFDGKKGIDVGSIVGAGVWETGETLFLGGLSTIASKVKKVMKITPKPKINLIGSNKQIDYSTNIEDVNNRIISLKESIDRYKSRGFSKVKGDNNYLKNYWRKDNELNKMKKQWWNMVGAYSYQEGANKSVGFLRNLLYLNKIKEEVKIEEKINNLIKGLQDIFTEETVNSGIFCENN